jgi:quercetin dioxygenase-like cupin family protein
MAKSKFKQKLLVTHPENSHFESKQGNNGAARPMFVYRELGVDKATGGAYNAHVIKGVPGSKPPIAEHKHTAMDFLFVYILKGWMKFDYVGHGEHTLKAGSCHVIPPGLSHTVTGWSDDIELLELTAPGEYKTVDTINGKPIEKPANAHARATRGKPHKERARATT